MLHIERVAGVSTVQGRAELPQQAKLAVVQGVTSRPSLAAVRGEYETT
jgi:hypothetical protein